MKKAIDTIKQIGYDTENKPLFDYVELPDLIKVIDNAPTVEAPTVDAVQYTLGYQDGFLEGKKICERPQGEWYDHIPNCLKARHGEYVLYKVDFLLDNLAREVNIMESARRMKGSEEE